MDSGESRILMDLQKPIDVARVNTYSWHKDDRAPQNFILWGSPASQTPDPAAAELDKAGWTRIASVDTSPLKNGGKHGSSVVNSGGILGSFRFLLWQNAKKFAGTFYTEMDVYEKGQPLPPLEASPSDQKLKQQALLSLGKIPDARAAAIIENWAERLLKNEVPQNLQLDLFEAASMRSEPSIKAKVTAYQDALPKEDKLAPYRLALNGGDPAQGKVHFEFHAAACFRCHSIGNWGSANAGPNLLGVGKRLTREKILESLIDPNAVVVAGYGVSSFKMNDGAMITGSVVTETEKEIVVKKADNTQVTIQVAEIKKRVPPVSPMPPMGTVLKTREIRDIIAFLATQQ